MQTYRYSYWKYNYRYPYLKWLFSVYACLQSWSETDRRIWHCFIWWRSFSCDIYESLINQNKIETISTGISFVYEYKWTRFRANVSKNNDGIAIAMRTIKKITPSAEDVWLDKNLLKLLNEDRGLILITWWTGSGKTTTVIAMIDYLNKNQHKHIIMIEDPVEYIIKIIKVSYIRNKFEEMFLLLSRQSVMLCEKTQILLWYERCETKRLLLRFSLLRKHDILLSQHFIRMMLYRHLIDWYMPSLLRCSHKYESISTRCTCYCWSDNTPKKDETGNLVAREVFINNDSSRNLIMEWNLSHLYSVMETGKQDGQIMMQDALIDLHRQDLISWKSLMQHIKDPIRLKDYLIKMREKQAWPEDQRIR